MTAGQTIESVDLAGFEQPAIPCEYPWPNGHGTPVEQCPREAAWIVWFYDPKPCGCKTARRHAFFCDPCWAGHERGYAECQKCKRWNVVNRYVIKAERL